MYIERYGVPDRSPTEDEPLPVRGNFSNQQEAPAQEASTKVNEPNIRLKTQKQPAGNHRRLYVSISRDMPSP